MAWERPPKLRWPKPSRSAPPVRGSWHTSAGSRDGKIDSWRTGWGGRRGDRTGRFRASCEGGETGDRVRSYEPRPCDAHHGIVEGRRNRRGRLIQDRPAAGEMNRREPAAVSSLFKPAGPSRQRIFSVLWRRIRPRSETSAGRCSEERSGNEASDPVAWYNCGVWAAEVARGRRLREGTYPHIAGASWCDRCPQRSSSRPPARLFPLR